MKRVQAQDPKIEKIISEAEREMLMELVGEVQAKTAAQDKFVDFLRKQHDATHADGWLLSEKGFFRQSVPQE